MLNSLISSWFSEEAVRGDYTASNTSVQHSYGMIAACTRQGKLYIVAELSSEYCCHVLFAVH